MLKKIENARVKCDRVLKRRRNKCLADSDCISCHAIKFIFQSAVYSTMFVPRGFFPDIFPYVMQLCEGRKNLQYFDASVPIVCIAHYAWKEKENRK